MKKIDYKSFWEENKKCLELGSDIPRVPVHIHLNGDWICDFMNLDCNRYYTDYQYQQEMRMRCGEITEKEMGYKTVPEIDFGVIMDASVYGGAMMCADKATPVLTHVVNEPGDIDVLVEKMQKVNLLEAGLIPEYLEWRERIIKDYGIHLRAGSCLKGCATMMGQIMGITNFLTWIVTEPEQIKKLIDCWYDMSVRYLRVLRKVTGNNSTKKFSFASDVAGMLSPDLYREFIKEKERLIYKEFAGGAESKRYYHADYRMMHLLPDLRDIGVNELNVDPYVDCNALCEAVPEATIYGQIPPTKVLLYGSPEEVKETVRLNIQQAGRAKKLIISPAGSINPGTSFDNLRAICEAAEEYGYIY